MALKSPLASVQAYRRRANFTIGANLGGYTKKVLGYSPIAYWPLDESAGSTAYCQVNPAQNGTYTGVTLANDATGSFGTAAPYFDGANDYVDIFTATLAGMANTSEGSVAIWAKVNAVGIWTDGTAHEAFLLFRDGANQIRLLKAAANNTVQGWHEGQNNAIQCLQAGHSDTAWMHWALTWSVASNELFVYADTVQTAKAGGNVTAWAGAPTSAFIGSYSAVPANPWHGWLAHCAVWDRVLSTSEIAGLANP